MQNIKDFKLSVSIGGQLKYRDKLSRPLKDLRISITDKCNFRCTYCMPRNIFDNNWKFLPKDHILSFEEIVRVASIFGSLGVEKIRITGGEPLIRRNIVDLIRMINHSVPEVDLSVTTNGSLLSKLAGRLSSAGLNRVTVSLDSLNHDIFAEINDTNTLLDEVLNGINEAYKNNLMPLKINSVIRKGINDNEILNLVKKFQGTGIEIRFIEFMDVGNSNDWKLDEVVTAEEMLKIISKEFELLPIPSANKSDVAKRWNIVGTNDNIGIISSISMPFCGDCSRARISADGKLFTCLFSNNGFNLKNMLRNGSTNLEIREKIIQIWEKRDDRYSELRKLSDKVSEKIEMSYIGG